MLNFVFHDGPYLYALPDRASAPLLAQWESLHRFLLRACAFHRDDRFQTAAEMAEQLTGVLREIVAVSEGRPRVSTSSLFENDQLSDLLMASSEAYDVGQPDWRVLPSPRVDEDDPAAPLLMSLPERDPGRAMELLEAAVAAGQVSESSEVFLHKARELVQAELNPDQALVEVEKANPWEWRVQWYRSMFQLQLGSAQAAAEGFSRVWTELPGETAPKLATALAAEMAGEHERAAEVYDLVISVDSSYVSAAFGLARCRAALGDAKGVVEALDRVPASSAAHYDAQVAIARALVAGGGPQQLPTVDDLQKAAATIERLQLDAAERAALSSSIYERALMGVRDGSIPAGSDIMLGQELNERSLQLGLEQTYRVQARLAATPADRVRLVDLANAVRPRSLF
jgi:serine/threonine-protein kinase PknG